MKMTNIPSAFDELNQLEPVIPLIYQALDRGTESAADFFEQAGKTVNPALYPELVRYFAAEELRDKGQVVEEFVQEPIGRNGLCLVYKKRRIRIWKATEDELPAPGTSSVKTGFLNQQLSWDLADLENPGPIERNLAILWNIDPRHRLSGLHLVYPRATASSWSPAAKYWSAEIHNPFLSDAKRPAGLEGSAKDLPIGLIEVERDSTETHYG